MGRVRADGPHLPAPPPLWFRLCYILTRLQKRMRGGWGDSVALSNWSSFCISILISSRFAPWKCSVCIIKDSVRGGVSEDVLSDIIFNWCNDARDCLLCFCRILKLLEIYICFDEIVKTIMYRSVMVHCVVQP